MENTDLIQKKVNNLKEIVLQTENYINKDFENNDQKAKLYLLLLENRKTLINSCKEIDEKLGNNFITEETKALSKKIVELEHTLKEHCDDCMKMLRNEYKNTVNSQKINKGYNQSSGQDAAYNSYN